MGKSRVMGTSWSQSARIIKVLVNILILNIYNLFQSVRLSVRVRASRSGNLIGWRAHVTASPGQLLYPEVDKKRVFSTTPACGQPEQRQRLKALHARCPSSRIWGSCCGSTGQRGWAQEECQNCARSPVGAAAIRDQRMLRAAWKPASVAPRRQQHAVQRQMRIARSAQTPACVAA